MDIQTGQRAEPTDRSRLMNTDKDRRERDIIRMILRVTGFLSLLGAFGLAFGQSHNETGAGFCFLAFLISIGFLASSAPRG